MGLLSKLFGGSQKDMRVKNELENYAETKLSYNIDEYYALLGKIQDWKSKKNYKKMLASCVKSLPLLPKLVENTKKEYGAFDISSIPAIEVGCRYWAAMNDKATLEVVKQVVASVAELQEGWGEEVEAAFEDEKLSARLQEYIKENPGILQSKLGKLLTVSGQDTGRIVNTLNNLGRIKRVKSGKSYELYVE